MPEPLKNSWYAALPEVAVALLQARDGLPFTTLQTLLGFAPPTPNAQTGTEQLSCAAIAPGRWFLTGTCGAIDGLRAKLDQLAPDRLTMLTDLTSSSLTFHLHGVRAMEWVSAHSTLDISPRAFPTGRAVRAPLGSTSMFLTRTGHGPDFRIMFDVTLAAYVAHLMHRYDGTTP